MNKTASESAAAQVRNRVLASTDRFWRVEHFDGASHAVVLELRRLVDAGELERVRRGVYWRGRKTRFGSSLPRALDVLREVVGDREAVGATGWYAANLLGLSTQVAPQPALSVTRRPPSGLRGIRIVDRTSRTGRRDARLSGLEATLLEALEGWERYVELKRPAALQRFVEILRDPEVRIDRLVRAARTESPIVRERLRAVLEHGGWTSEAAKITGARSGSSRERALRVVPEALHGAPA